MGHWGLLHTLEKFDFGVRILTWYPRYIYYLASERARNGSGQPSLYCRTAPQIRDAVLRIPPCTLPCVGSAVANYVSVYPSNAVPCFSYARDARILFEDGYMSTHVEFLGGDHTRWSQKGRLKYSRGLLVSNAVAHTVLTLRQEISGEALWGLVRQLPERKGLCWILEHG